eukprot:TRINITY_DN8522_c0_g1_i2.p1 TRINITY_DN8522_c0_g1~~TRINITY_DN8522_c0_g1_i2.p1  ORF type:complete len:972 (+),score=220.16 TRINITY_DN8522_c0_g1_i2:98-3013(+)
MGFRREDATLAAACCGTVPSALDWLCLNIPEDALPRRYEAGGNLDVVVSSYGTLKKRPTPALQSSSPKPASPSVANNSGQFTETQIQQLGELEARGFEHATCEAAIEYGHGQFHDALIFAFSETLFNTTPQPPQAGDKNTALAEELELLKCMYTEEELTAGQCSGGTWVSLMLKSLPAKVLPASVDVYVPGWSKYPAEVPIVSFLARRLTPHQNFCFTQALVDKAKGLVGAPMTYELLSWLTENGDSLLRRSRRHDVAAAAPFTPVPTSTSPSLETLGEETTTSSSTSPAVVPDSQNSHSEPAIMSEPSTNTDTQPQQQKITRMFSLNGAKIERVADGAPAATPLPLFHPVPLPPVGRRATAHLPVRQHTAEVVSAIFTNRVVVITGEPGCGKSTQIPQLILECMTQQGTARSCRVVITQPRRIAAVGIAERVAHECGEAVGKTAGYQIRMQSCASRDTKLLFCTTGIVLRKMREESFLDSVSHIIVDEAHERDVDTDFLLMLLKSALPRHPRLKVILMSATLDSSLFSTYFGGAPIVCIPGTLFPVECFSIGQVRHMLHMTSADVSPAEGDENDDGAAATADSTSPTPEGQVRRPPRRAQQQISATGVDGRLVARAVLWCTVSSVKEGGSILVFLPGMADIIGVRQQLLDPATAASAGLQAPPLLVLPLHSSLSVQQQQRVFERAPAGTVKVVLSTNIAESSITIDDVTVVIDAGLENQMVYDPDRRTSEMKAVWISRASAKQRLGRAGRIRRGVCFRLYADDQLCEYALPEILRTPLQALCLSIMKMQIGAVQQVLSLAPSPPSPVAVADALNLLREIGACVGDTLTPLGSHLAELPLDPFIGKLLVFGAILGCTEFAITLAAIFSTSRSMFITAMERRSEVDKVKITFGASTKSDHIMWVKVYNQWAEADCNGSGFAFCAQNCLSIATLKEVRATRQHLAVLLCDIGFLDPAYMRVVTFGSARPFCAT